MVYLILVNITLTICYALYSMFFKKLTFFQWNRFYLLGSVVLALLIPIGLFIDLSDIWMMEQRMPTIDLGEVIDMDVVIIQTLQTGISVRDLIVPLYWIAVGISLLVMLYRFYRVRLLFRQEHERLSFSFFGRIFLGGQVRQHQTISVHEQVHVRQGHSYDVLFLELVKAFNWFNPVVYFYQKELKFQHECIADEICSEDKLAYAELLVAHALDVDDLQLANGFSNHSFLKKRIMMLFKNKSQTKHRYLYLAIAPVLLLVVASTLVFNTSKAKDIVADIENQVLDVNLPVSPLSPKVQASAANVDEDLSAIAFMEEQNTAKQDGIMREVNPQDTTGNELFTEVEVFPEPKGGMIAFRKWIEQNYDYPLKAIDAGVKGTVLVSYIVEKDGSLSNVKVVKDLGHGTGEAAVDMIKKAEKWSPGIQNGRPVRVAFSLPIRLDLTQQEKVSGVSTIAEPKMGFAAFRDWFATNFKSPRALTANDVDPVLLILYEVGSDAKIKNLQVVSDLDEAFKQEAIRLFKAVEWLPTDNAGTATNVRRGLFFKIGSDNKIIRNYTRVEVQAEPKGGMATFYSYLINNYRMPTEFTGTKKLGQATVEFVVGKDGGLKSSKVLNESSKGIGEQVSALIKKFGNWAPAILDGKNKESLYSITINLDDSATDNRIKVKINKYSMIKSS